jgi:hypothetical protein
MVAFCFLIIISCNCQNKVTNSANQKVERDYIAAMLEDKNFNILLNTKTIIGYEIRQQLIEGTENEYSNKLFLKDTLSKPLVANLIGRLTNDSSYNWNILPENVIFEPKNQFLLKSETGRLTLLIDKSYKHISFINLEGQRIVNLSDEFAAFLKNL